MATDATVFPRPSRTYSIRHVARAADGYVAFGRDTGAGALWRSSDGSSWARQAAAEDAFRDGQVDALTVGNGLIVTAGAGPPAVPNVANVAAVWISDDGGSTWRRMDPENPAFSIRLVTQIFGVTSGTRGFVAVGLSWDNVHIDAHAWYSADGRIWRRAADPAAWSGPSDQVMGKACTLPDGGFLALGYSTVLGERDDWAWTSADGITWEASPTGPSLVPGGPRMEVASCTGTPAGVLVAGGVDGPGGRDGALLRTTDGRTWAPVGSPGALSRGQHDDSLDDVAADGDEIVVAAHEGDDIRVYTSADGGRTRTERSGAAFRGPGRQYVREVSLAGSQVLLAGDHGASGAVWIGPAP